MEDIVLPSVELPLYISNAIQKHFGQGRRSEQRNDDSMMIDEQEEATM
jgi:hypothetical protein